MSDKKYTAKEELLAKYAKALGHPARIAILNFLNSQDTCFFGDIQEILPIAKATVSQHLTELKNANLIQGEIIPPKVKYCINKNSWIEVSTLFGGLIDNCIKSEKCCR